MFVPYFYIAVGATTFAVELKIISSDDNPDYKIPWMLFVLIIPVVGLMLYFIFGSRKLKNKYLKRLQNLKSLSYKQDDSHLLNQLENENPTIGILLCKEKNDALVEITLPKDANIYASEYKLYLPDKKLLQQKLKEWIEEEEL